jgi:hypothetical protein
LLVETQHARFLELNRSRNFPFFVAVYGQARMDAVGNLMYLIGEFRLQRVELGFCSASLGMVLSQDGIAIFKFGAEPVNV